jgi:hypothetical protein
MTKQEALSILRPEGNTAEALKQAYRAAAFKFHPDHGGDLEIMKLVNAAYDLLKKETWTIEEKEEADQEVSIAEELLQQWNKIKFLPKIIGEIAGRWIWVTGETWRHKKILKDIGFKWSPNKAAWYWHEADYKKKNGKKYSLDDIRKKYGSHGLRTESQSALA